MIVHDFGQPCLLSSVRMLLGYNNFIPFAYIRCSRQVSHITCAPPITLPWFPAKSKQENYTWEYLNDLY